MATQAQPSFINFIKEHPWASALTLGGVSAAVLYYITRTPEHTKQLVSIPVRKRIKTQASTQNNYQIQQAEIQHALNHLKTTRQKLITAAKNFKIEFLQEEILTSLLTQECLLKIFDKCIDLVDEQELNKIYQTSRRARRTIFTKILINAQIKQMNRRQSLQSLKSAQHNEPSFLSPMDITSPQNIKSLKQMLQKNTPISYPEALAFSEMYYRFVCTFEQEFKYLIEKTQKDFATFLNIDFSLITESINFHISKEDNKYFKQKIQEWTSAIREVLKPKLVKYLLPIEPNKIKQILEYQVKYLNEKRQRIRETIHKLGISNQQQLQPLPTLLATILQDEVFNKFGVQQQQMNVEMTHFSQNKELEAVVEEFQMLTEAITEEMYEQANKDVIIDDEGDYV